MLEWSLISRTTLWQTMGLKVVNMAHRVTPGSLVTVACLMPITQALAWVDP